MTNFQSNNISAILQMSQIPDELSNHSSWDVNLSSQNNDSSLEPPLEFEVFELRDTINIVAYFSMSAGKHICRTGCQTSQQLWNKLHLFEKFTPSTTITYGISIILPYMLNLYCDCFKLGLRMYCTTLGKHTVQVLDSYFKPLICLSFLKTVTT